MSSRTLLLLLAVSLATSASAQPVDRHTVVLDLSGPGCDAAETGQEFVGCVADALLRADRELDETYARALEVAESERGLRAAQRAWIVYRDADCEGGLSEDALGAGHWRTGHIEACRYEKTRLRVAELRWRFLRE